MAKLKKFVWDTPALLNIKEPNDEGYSPAYSLFKDLSDGWIKGPYKNIFPAISVFELNASISRKHRDGAKILREYYIMGQNEIIYDIDSKLIKKSVQIFEMKGFSKLRGGDLIFACIAYLENAFLVTLDNGFSAVADNVRVINLNESRTSARYRNLFDP